MLTGLNVKQHQTTYVIYNNLMEPDNDNSFLKRMFTHPEEFNDFHLFDNTWEEQVRPRFFAAVDPANFDEFGKSKAFYGHSKRRHEYFFYQGVKDTRERLRKE